MLVCHSLASQVQKKWKPRRFQTRRENTSGKQRLTNTQRQNLEPKRVSRVEKEKELLAGIQGMIVVSSKLRKRMTRRHVQTIGDDVVSKTKSGIYERAYNIKKHIDCIETYRSLTYTMHTKHKDQSLLVAGPQATACNWLPAVWSGFQCKARCKATSPVVVASKSGKRLDWTRL
jgi:hypothetical protein